MKKKLRKKTQLRCLYTVRTGSSSLLNILCQSSRPTGGWWGIKASFVSFLGHTPAKRNKMFKQGRETFFINYFLFYVVFFQQKNKFVVFFCESRMSVFMYVFKKITTPNHHLKNFAHCVCGYARNVKNILPQGRH